ncbi:MAG TPA: hypothetical protein VJY34_23605, partial [Roseiarcus sp.]|nr:hypothetical protein [Roseiarcus sp.]
MTTIKALRILPPFAIARLGSAKEPMDNYSIDVDPPRADATEPLGYRALKPMPTLIVNDQTGEIERIEKPSLPLEFKKNGEIRPVAPFLEVFAVSEDDELVPLTIKELTDNGYKVEDVSWGVTLANRKVARRTGDKADVVATGNVTIADHDVHELRGACKNFVDGASVVFGHARFIKPTDASDVHKQIRLRFTPAKGLIYGPKAEPGGHVGAEANADKGDETSPGQLYRIPPGPGVYDPAKGGIWMIGIGGCLAAPPLPHHLAYGSVPRRFDRVKLGRARRFGGDRASRNSC